MVHPVQLPPLSMALICQLRANVEFIFDVKNAGCQFPVKENQANLLRAIEDESITSGKGAYESLEKGHPIVVER
jgi:hypothetical protein